MTDIYPITIVLDRYMGVYSRGEWIAWNCHPWEIPEEPFGDDLVCAEFWWENAIIVGLGSSPEEAADELYKITNMMNNES